MDASNLSGNVYLYQRFSSSKQEGNSSLFRQGEAQKEWLSRHPNCVVVELDEQPLIDSGVSAYKGKHVEHGSLGRLVKAIESGLVETGSIILVEHFSRLTRMDIDQSEDLIKKIWKHGVSIVTARGNNYYPPEAVNDTKSRIALIIEIEKAHEESKWRSKKVKSSWRQRESLAREHKIPPRMRMPFWLSPDGTLNEFAPVVRDLFSLHAMGKGQIVIARELRERYGSIKPLLNHNPTKLIRILQNEKCIGKVYGEKLYEAVVDEETFYSAQRIHQERLYTSIREDRKWPLHGMVKCGHCGSGMSIQQSKDSLPLIRCSRKQRSGGDSCQSASTFPYVIAYHFFIIYIEPVLMAMMTDNKRLKSFELDQVKLQQEIRKSKAELAEADLHRKARLDAGKNAKASLTIMDELQDNIDSLEESLSVVHAKIAAQKSLSSISKDIYELSVENPKEYNLELNKTGLKIHLKDKKLSFYDPDNKREIASLRYVKYNRSRLSYEYTFQGVKEYYKTELHSSEVRTKDWTLDKLLNPRRERTMTPNDLAALMHNLKIHEQSGTSFKLKSNE
ncbi:recombinase family protein [Alteromonas sp. C1M14]|uniref:recombinase family protein n=1 Tax=Alteromonas sp. C1M14 TaxID=2841567 RepID=UPI001C0A52DE|nr:recombinase family protein [Alteromonas sp. C1M14]MBU2979735.1 recombinase family protein [Alteromonas sp. C1M14]